MNRGAQCLQEFKTVCISFPLKFKGPAIGQLCLPPKRCWNPNPQYLRIWTYIKIGPWYMSLVKMRSLVKTTHRVDLYSNMTCALIRRREETQRETQERRNPTDFRGSMVLSTSRFQTSGLQNHEVGNFCCFKPLQYMVFNCGSPEKLRQVPWLKFCSFLSTVTPLIA